MDGGTGAETKGTKEGEEEGAKMRRGRQKQIAPTDINARATSIGSLPSYLPLAEAPDQRASEAIIKTRLEEARKLPAAPLPMQRPARRQTRAHLSKQSVKRSTAADRRIRFLSAIDVGGWASPNFPSLNKYSITFTISSPIPKNPLSAKSAHEIPPLPNSFVVALLDLCARYKWSLLGKSDETCQCHCISTKQLWTGHILHSISTVIYCLFFSFS